MNNNRIINPNNNIVRDCKSRTTETGKTATPYALTFLFGSTIGGLSAPAIIAADMAWEGMKQIYSNIDNWGRNLPNQIINSH